MMGRGGGCPGSAVSTQPPLPRPRLRPPVLEAIVAPQLHCAGDASSCQQIPYYCGTDCPPGATNGYITMPLETAFQTYYGEVGGAGGCLPSACQ